MKMHPIVDVLYFTASTISLTCYDQLIYLHLNSLYFIIREYQGFIVSHKYDVRMVKFLPSRTLSLISVCKLLSDR